MGLFSDGFVELKKAGEPLYKTPKSIQETIEIMKVAENGIFEVAKTRGANLYRYSKCYRFSDINYTTTNEEEQIDIFERYCKFLNSIDCAFKITVNNKNRDMNRLRDHILLRPTGDDYDKFRRIYNDIIEEKIREGRQGIEQERYLTITIERKNFEEAKAQFATIEATVHKAFGELGAEITPLSGNERLKVLHDFYHLGSEDAFDFDIKKGKKVGADFKNDLAGGMIKYYSDHIEDEGKFSRALFIKKYPSSLSDRFLNEITSLPVHCITSIDIVPVPKDITTKVLQKKYLGIESDIIKQQRVRNKNNDFSSEISYKTVMVVPKPLIGQTASEFLRLYPSANILVATENDFAKKKRQQFVARIATGDYDCIIMSHSQFERIPVSKERQQELLDRQITEITHAIEEMKEADGERWSVKQMEAARKRLEEQLKELTDSPKDDLITFEELGIDSIMVDDDRVIIRTKLGKARKIKGFALI